MKRNEHLYLTIRKTLTSPSGFKSLFGFVVQQTQTFYYGFAHCIVSHFRPKAIELAVLLAGQDRNRIVIQNYETYVAVDSVLPLRKCIEFEMGAHGTPCSTRRLDRFIHYTWPG